MRLIKAILGLILGLILGVIAAGMVLVVGVVALGLAVIALAVLLVAVVVCFSGGFCMAGWDKRSVRVELIRGRQHLN